MYVAQHLAGTEYLSQVAAINTTAKNEYGAVRNQLVLGNKTAIPSANEKKFFDPGGEQGFVPYRQDRLVYQRGLECAT